MDDLTGGRIGLGEVSAADLLRSPADAGRTSADPLLTGLPNTTASNMVTIWTRTGREATAMHLSSPSRHLRDGPHSGDRNRVRTRRVDHNRASPLNAATPDTIA